MSKFNIWNCYCCLVVFCIVLNFTIIFDINIVVFCSNSLLNCCWFVAVTSCWLFNVAALAIDGVVAAPSEIAKRVITLALLAILFHWWHLHVFIKFSILRLYLKVKLKVNIFLILFLYNLKKRCLNAVLMESISNFF